MICKSCINFDCAFLLLIHFTIFSTGVTFSLKASSGFLSFSSTSDKHIKLIMKSDLQYPKLRKFLSTGLDPDLYLLYVYNPALSLQGLSSLGNLLKRPSIPVPL